MSKSSARPTTETEPSEPEVAAPEIVLPYTVKLSAPFQWGKDETITEVVFEREPTGADMVYAQNAGDKVGLFTLRLVERTSGLPEPLLRALPMRDYMALCKVAQTFLGDGPGIG